MLLGFVILSSAFGIYLAIINHLKGSLIRTPIYIVVSLLLCKFSSKLRGWVDYVIPLFVFGTQIAWVIQIDNGKTDSERNTFFHYACYFTTIERILISEITRLEPKILITAVSAAFRFVFLPVSSVNLIILEAVISLFGLYAEYRKEKRDRGVFNEFHRYRGELIKFKDLISSDLPTNILILSEDLGGELFHNDCFEETFGVNFLEKNANLDKWLSLLKIEKDSFNEASREAMDLDDSLIPDLTLLKIFEKLQAKGLLNDLEKKFSFTVKTQGSEGSSTPGANFYSTKVFSLMWDGQRAVAIILNDVTQQYLNLSLKVANANKDRVLAMVSHELRTPLNAILGMVHIMEKQTGDKEILENLSVCKISGKLLISFIDSILDLGQIRYNRLKLNVSTFDVKVFILEIYYLFEFQFKQKGIFFKTKISKHVPQYLNTDQNRLRQVVINLVSNALKFTFEGEVILSIDKHPSSDKYLLFTVEDTGTGISDADQKKLFQMYGQTANHMEANFTSEGMGFGLTLSEQLVRLLLEDPEHQGIQVKSKPGEGSTFSFPIKIQLKEREYQTEGEMGDEEGKERNISTGDFEGRENQLSSYILNVNSLSRSHLMSGHFRKVDSNINNQLQIPKTAYSVKVSNTSMVSRGDLNVSSNTILAPSQISIWSPKDDMIPLNKAFYKEKDIILIVDDSPFNLMVAKHFVVASGYQVKTALNGKIAVNVVKDSLRNGQWIALIIMDLQMPIMDGYEATKILRKMTDEGEIPDIPIVALSANDTEADKSKCLKVGMLDHLSKPLTEVLLKGVLNKYCR